MRFTVQAGLQNWRVCMDAPHDLSIPLDFGGPQVSAFGLPPATAHPCRGEDFVLSVAQGAPVNCETVQLTPHGNVTHTECYGHISAAPLHVLDVLRGVWFPATLVTLAPRAVRVQDEDFPRTVLTREIFQYALAEADADFLRALVVRTLPNDSIKKTMAWSGTNPAFVAADAMDYIVELGVQHLVVDLPSVDPEKDGGRLAAHRAFWEGQGGRARTITELAYADPHIPDGRYLLNLQVAPFVLDASPSRPLLFEVEPAAS